MGAELTTSLGHLQFESKQSFPSVNLVSLLPACHRFFRIGESINKGNLRKNSSVRNNHVWKKRKKRKMRKAPWAFQWAARQAKNRVCKLALMFVSRPYNVSRGIGFPVNACMVM